MGSPATKFWLQPAFRYLLFPLAMLYWGVIFWRNLFYTVGFFVSRKLPCKVISIGNLSLGGTGKTPAVIYLAGLLVERGHKVAILSRGYRRKTSGTVRVSDGETYEQNWQKVGDEPYLMARQLPGVPIVVDESRYRGGVYLVKHFNPDIIILDDGFQHRQLERDLDIVLINARDSVKDSKLIPYGKLREPWFHLRRADIIFWTKTNLANPQAALKSKINKTPCDNFTSTMAIDTHLYGAGNSIPISSFEDKPFLAVSAIGDPEGFERSLSLGGVKIVDHITYSDHHDYSKNDIADLKQRLEASGASAIITTEKDMLKFAALEGAEELPVFSLRIRFQPSAGGEQALLRLISNSLKN